ncbi:MAG: glycosyltransferase family 1 protein [Sphaerobacter thermophilus]|nr:glycosyltransferase family 1 protein [Sphaerobacter thermophilus]
MDVAHCRVALDGRFLQQPTTGSGQYSLHLWQALAATADEPTTVLVRPDLPMPVDPQLGGGAAGTTDTIRVPIPPWVRHDKAEKLWWEQRGLLRGARQAGARLLHVPYFAGPRFTRLPLVITVHDVIPFIFPEYGGGRLMRLYLRLVSAVARRADAIITDSDCSRRDITAWLGIPSERIHVIPLAVDPAIRPSDDPETASALRARYGLPGPVIFNVGGLDARKNVPVLIEAFAQALPDLPPETRLVIAGRAHSGNQRLYPPLEPVIRRLGVEERVVLTGSITDEEKVALYNLADLYVFPSLYEGFGLSPLEAMACGTPVIAANRSSLPEVVGQGGLLVDPTPERLAAAMVSVMRDERLRRSLARRALEQAETFSWQRTAEQTRAVYRSVLASATPAPA